MSSGYVPVRLTTLKGEKPFEFGIYIKLGERYVLYTNAGDSLSEDRRLNLKNKKVRQLFIQGSDEGKYQDFLEAKLTQAANDPAMSQDDKADVAVGASSDAVEKVYQDPGSKSSYVGAQKTLGGLVDIIGQNNEVVKAILNKSQEVGEHENFLINHSISVSTLVIKLALKLKLDAPVVSDLGMAGYLHDIGVVKMAPEDKELFRKPYDQFSKEEMARYKEHPDFGAKILQDKEYATKEIIELILTHEENLSGKGFPQKLQKLSRPQELLSLCCAYDRRVTCLAEKGPEVIKDMMINSIGNYQLDLLKSFKEMLKEEGLLA